MKPASGLLLALALTASPLLASAGIYSDGLARCLVESSTQQDRNVFVRWMFTAMSLHPAVSDIASVQAPERSSANKSAGALFTRLLTETCQGEAKRAVQYEGPVAIQTAFTVFGQVAGQELMQNPNVAQGMGELDSYIDGEKLQSALGLSAQ